jgi:hypothetical protein
MSELESPKWFKFAPLKKREKKEVKEKTQLGGMWKVPMFGGLWKVLMFSGFWKVPIFGGLYKVPMFIGPWKEKKKHHFHIFSFSLQQILLNFFSINLKVLPTMVLNCYFTPFLLFPWPINYNHASQCIKSSTNSSPSWFWSKIFFFLSIHDVTHDQILRALSRTSESRTISKVIPRFDINATFS